MVSQRFLSVFFLSLSIVLLGRCAVAQGQLPELTMTFDFIPGAPTSTDSLAVQIGFDGGGIGVAVGSTVLSQLDIAGNQLYLSITVEPPPPSDLVLPAFFMLNPVVVELGVFSPGYYQINAEVLGFSGESSFVVVPEPSTIAMVSLAVFSLGIFFRRVRNTGCTTAN